MASRDWTTDTDGRPVRLLPLRPAEPVATLVEVRETFNAKVRALFLSKPRQWITVKALAEVGGFAAWRTRVSQVRRQFHKADEGTIEWNNDPKNSCYRYLPHMPLGPDAATPRQRGFW